MQLSLLHLVDLVDANHCKEATAIIRGPMLALRGPVPVSLINCPATVCTDLQVLFALFLEARTCLGAVPLCIRRIKLVLMRHQVSGCPHPAMLSGGIC